MAALRLDPENAAASIAVRIKTIAQCEDYIRATVARYDGLKAFHELMAAHKIADAVARIVAKKD